MARGLQAARDLAERVRYSGDVSQKLSEGQISLAHGARNHFFQNNLRIAADVTPALSDNLDLVQERLRIPNGCVEAFVYSSPEVQAACLAGSGSECVIRFTSSLINLLDEEEFCFVAGHEIGHFLFDHCIASAEQDRESAEAYMQQRAEEISADRLGLLSCGSLDAAIRALMKTASGLSNRHLRFDVGTFISQLRDSSQYAGHGSHLATHPSILVRCRALLWFSLDRSPRLDAKEVPTDSKQMLDDRIQADLDRHVDGPARRYIKQASDDLTLWLAAYEAVQKGVFEQSDQAMIGEMFGPDTRDKLIRFLQEIPAQDVEDVVYKKMKVARDDLESIIPARFDSEVTKIRRRISRKFSTKR